MTFTFNGTDVGWVATRGTNGGKVDVYVDGTRLGSVDLALASTEYRRMVFRRHFSVKGSHVLELRRISGTLDVDAFVVLR